VRGIILSAGQGRRRIPLTTNTPKCGLMLEGKTLLEQQVEPLVANGDTLFTKSITLPIWCMLKKLSVAGRTGVQSPILPYFIRS